MKRYVRCASAAVVAAIVWAAAVTDGLCTVPGTGSIRGKVQNQAGAGLRAVVFAYGFSGEPWSSVDTAPDGAYSLDDLPPGPYSLRISAQQNYVGQWLGGLAWTGGDTIPHGVQIIQVTAGGVAANVDVTLRPGGTISGRAVDGAGNPATNAWVSVMNPNNSEVKELSTLQDGTFSVGGLPSGQYFVIVRPGAQNLLPQWYSGVAETGWQIPDGVTAVSVTEGQISSGINFTLAAGIRISGRVLSKTGNPLQGIFVTVYRPNGDQIRSARTDVNGNYTVVNLTAGRYFLKAEDRDARVYADLWYTAIPDPDTWGIPAGATAVEISVAAPGTGVNFAMEQGGVLQGRVTDELGNPQAGVDVNAMNADNAVAGWSSTDGDGRFAIRGLHTGSYFVEADAQELGYITEWYPNVRTAEQWGVPYGSMPVAVQYGQNSETINIALTRGGIVQGVLRTAANQPIQNARVSVYDVDENFLSDTWTGPDGAYQLGGIPPGLVFLKAEGGGFLAKWFDNVPVQTGYQQHDFGVPDMATGVRVVSGVATGNVNFVLDGGASIAGRIQDANGVPIHNASVQLWGVDMMGYGTQISSTFTDLDGKYSFSALAPGEYQLRADGGPMFLREWYDNVAPMSYWSSGVPPQAATKVAVAERQSRTGIDFVLNFAGGIAGFVTTGNGARRVNTPVGISVCDMQSNSLFSVSTDANGHYLAQPLPDGNYTVQVTPWGANYLPKWYAATVRIVNGQITEPVNFDLLPAGIIEGRVTDGSGAGIGDSLVTAIPVGPGNGMGVYTDADGFFRIQGLPAGNYGLLAESPWDMSFKNEWYNGVYGNLGGVPAQATRIVVVTGVTTGGVNFTLDPNGVVAGTITSSDGLPVGGQWVSLRTSSGSQFGSGTDAMGRYEIVGVGAGTYYLVTSIWDINLMDQWYVDVPDIGYSWGTIPNAATPIVVGDGARATANLVLNKGGVVTGTITDSQGRPVPHANVSIYQKTPTGQESVGYDTSNMAGEYRVFPLPAGTYYASVSHGRYLPEWYNNLATNDSWNIPANAAAVVVPAQGIVEGINFALSEGGKIRGVVRSADGTPLPGVQMVLGTQVNTYLEAVDTDRDGRYEFGRLFSGTYYVHTMADDFGYRDEWYDNTPFSWVGGIPAEATGIPVVIDQVAANIDFNLSMSGGIIQGSVRGEGDAPLSAVEISAYSGTNSSDLAFTGQTSADGTFRLAGIAAGTYYVYADPEYTAHKEYLGEWYDGVQRTKWPMPVTVAPVGVTYAATSTVSFTLQKGGVIAGRVRDVTGAPVPNLQVTIFDTDLNYIDSPQTDLNGRYSTKGLLPGNYYVKTDGGYFNRTLTDEWFPNVPVDPNNWWMLPASAKCFTLGLGVRMDNVNFTLSRSGLQPPPQTGIGWTEAGRLSVFSNAQDVVVVGNYAYVADGDAGLQIVDISTPASPVTIGGYDTAGFASGVAVAGNYAYVADGDKGLQVVNVSNPASPARTGGFDTAGIASDVAVSGNFAFVADGDAGLQILNVSDLANPARAGGFDTAGTAEGVVVVGNTAYVADGTAGLLILNIGDPAAPTRLGGVELADYAMGLAVSGNYAYVADFDVGFQVVDVSAPDAPMLKGLLPTKGEAKDVVLAGNYAYVADGSAGLQVVDIRDPMAPTRAAGADTPDTAEGVAVVGGNAFIADGTNGLIVLSGTLPSGTVQFTSATRNPAENAGTLTFIVTRSGSSLGAARVNYATVNGTATAGSDYTAASGTLSWANGDSAAKTFTVTLLDDTVYEGNETFTVNLSAPAGVLLGDPLQSVVTIAENELPPRGTLQLSANSYHRAENGVTVDVVVTRQGGSYGGASVNYAMVNGTATDGSDYTGASGTIMWADGDSADKTLRVRLLDDSTFEGDETFTVSIYDAAGAALGIPAQATVTIVENDSQGPGTLQLASAAYRVNEDAGTVTVTVTRTDGNTGAASVNYATANGTAASGSDYTVRSGTLNWAAGDDAAKTFTVTILDDTRFEGDEAFTVSLSGATGATLGTTAQAAVTITDNDPMQRGTVQLSAASGSVGENVGTVTITVTRQNGSDGAASVNYATVNGSALSGSDYTEREGTLTWAAGDGASKTFTVPVLEDSRYEGNETFTVILSDATGAALGTPAQATVTITDNDPAQRGTVQLSAAAYSIAENGGTVRITVTRRSGTDGAASVNFATANVTATSGADYTPANGTLDWADGDGADKTIVVALQNDAIYEGNEIFGVTLSGVTGAALGTPAQAAVTITDDEAPQPGTLQFSAATCTRAENGGTVTITVTRQGGSYGAASVGYMTANGTATAGADYTVKSGMLNWAANDSADKTITITILNDSVFEGDETFVVNLGLVTGATLGTPSQATVTITDDEAPQTGQVKLNATAYSTTEGAGSVTITVVRQGGSYGAASVNYATANGTATAGADYTAANGTLNWAANDSAAKTFTVAILDDADTESLETFTVTLSGVAGATLGTPEQATVRIAMNDQPIIGDVLVQKPGTGQAGVLSIDAGGVLGEFVQLFAALPGWIVRDFGAEGLLMQQGDGGITKLVPVDMDGRPIIAEAVTLAPPMPSLMVVSIDGRRVLAQLGIGGPAFIAEFDVDWARTSLTRINRATAGMMMRGLDGNHVLVQATTGAGYIWRMGTGGAVNSTVTIYNGAIPGVILRSSSDHDVLAQFGDNGPAFLARFNFDWAMESLLPITGAPAGATLRAIE